MHNRGFRWLVLLLAFAFVVGACSGEVTDSASEVPDPSDSPTSTVADTTDTAASSADTDETVADGGDASGDTGAADAAASDDSVADSAAEDAGPNIYEDPRGGIFLEFQQGFDRGDHPFTQVDSFCLPHEAAANRVATDDGISADSIRVGHIRSTLEDLDALGFGVPVGDPKEAFEVYIDYINNECGGIRGRMLDLGYAEADVLGDVDLSRNAACLAMTEDHQSVIVMNSTGFQGSANLCLVEEKETIFISTQGQPEEYMKRSNDRLVSLSPTQEDSLRFTLTDLRTRGELEGLTLGVAVPNTPGQVEAVEQGLVNPLREDGIDIVFDVIDCGGGIICVGGTPESVANMVNAGVDGFFNVLNVVSAPAYIAEMANQGFEHGDVRFFASDFNTQTSELVAGQIANNVDAGNLYNGATVIDYRTTGDYRDPNYVPNPFLSGCNQLYADHSPTGTSHRWGTEGDSAYEMVGSICGIVRIMARALYDAGDNPTLDDVHDAMINLGPVDNNAMTPASLRPGKTQMADVIQTLDFSFPCDQPLPFVRNSGDPICITGRNDFRPAPR